jgi:hypothetical protein
MINGYFWIRFNNGGHGMRAVVFILILIFHSLSAFSQNWKCLGPFSVPLEAGSAGGVGMGQVTCMAFHPKFGIGTNRTMYAGGAGGGVWKTTDEGKNWKVLNTDTLPMIRVSDIAVNPKNPDIIYFSTGSREGINRDGFLANGADVLGGHSIGIFKTKNGNSTDNKGVANCRWSHSIGKWHAGKDKQSCCQEDFWNFPSRKVISKLAISQKDPDILFALVNFAHQGVVNINGVYINIPDSAFVYKTSDGGDTWFRMLALDNDFLFDLEFRPGSTDTLYISSQKKIFQTLDGGLSWKNLSSMAFDEHELPAARSESRIELAVSKQKPDEFLACIFNIKNGYVGFRIILSQNEGRSFALQNKEGSYADGTGGRAGFDVSDLNSGLIAIGMNQLSFSSDKGVKVSINIAGGYSASGYNYFHKRYMHADIQKIRFSPF